MIADQPGVRPSVQPGPSSRPIGAGLPPTIVVALDAARAVAAIYVVLHHVAKAHGLLHGPGLILLFGQEAVIVFFLLSGFVIFNGEQRRALHPRGYYARRVRRIYPVLIAAMVVSTLVAADNGDLAARFDWRSLGGTLAGLQDIAAIKPGVIVDPYLDNLPLWSLSYELAFYLVFPPILMLWNRHPRATDHLVGIICCLCYGLYALHPNHAALVGAYFMIWWSGAMAARAYLAGGRDVRAIGAAPWWLAACSLCAGLVVTIVGSKGFGVYPMLPFRHMVVALAMLCVCFGPIGGAIARRSTGLALPFGFLASISYGLYVFHYPLLVDWRRADSLPWFLAALILLVAVSHAAETIGRPPRRR